MKWFLPSHNGDIRVEGKSRRRTLLTIHEPTPHELDLLNQFGRLFQERGWSKTTALWDPAGKAKQTVTLKGPVAEIGAALVQGFKAGEQTLTAVVFRNGEIETYTGAKSALKAAEDIKDREEKGKDGDKAEKAATVKRPTPCCPNCIPDFLTPAGEVLYEFLTPEEQRLWEEEHAVVAVGQITQHRYLISHRNSPRAQAQGKICIDLDAGGAVLHFHDWSVPPEEEVLASKLILENAEPWLRHEATLAPHPRFKNPFGGFADGVADASFTATVGDFLRSLSR